MAKENKHKNVIQRSHNLKLWKNDPMETMTTKLRTLKKGPNIFENNKKSHIINNCEDHEPPTPIVFILDQMAMLWMNINH
jgi:hypothetical protein